MIPELYTGAGGADTYPPAVPDSVPPLAENPPASLFTVAPLLTNCGRVLPPQALVEFHQPCGALVLVYVPFTPNSGLYNIFVDADPPVGVNDYLPKILHRFQSCLP